MTKDVAYLFMCVLPNLISSFVRYPFKSFAYFFKVYNSLDLEKNCDYSTEFPHTSHPVCPIIIILHMDGTFVTINEQSTNKILGLCQFEHLSVC